MALFDSEQEKTTPSVIDLVGQFQQEEVQELREAAEALDRARANTHLEYLFRFARLKVALAAQPAPNNGVAIYHVGTLFLRECFLYLTQGAPEFAHYVSGVRDGNSFTLDRMVNFRYARQSAAGVVGDPADTTRALLLIDRFGHRLHGWFHSHPDMGPTSYVPSGTDMQHQARLEEGGYPAIGAVFTRDGHIKFFSHHRPFQVNIYGKGVEQIDETLFRFEADFVGDQGS